ncbi:MAG TPA: hypothetical protein VFK52_00870 [Nocardioidaceae bacterium]|nr:hypothetical protein [Nocardioidaceae bacterium]
MAPHDLVLLLDVMAKVVLLLLLVRVGLDPTWGNLEGKAPVARAVTYPLVAFVIPVVWALWFRGRPFPWLPDLLVTLTGFTDILGNRLDLYDSVVWFDDTVHLVGTGLVGAAAVLLTMRRAAFTQVLQRALAVGLSAELAWELFEYVSFVTRSAEFAGAYRDTIGDLVLGWIGCVLAAVVIVLRWRWVDGRLVGAPVPTTEDLRLRSERDPLS